MNFVLFFFFVKKYQYEVCYNISSSSSGSLTLTICGVLEFKKKTDFWGIQENMESSSNHGGIKLLLAAEHEAQQIVNAARTGNYLQASSIT